MIATALLAAALSACTAESPPQRVALVELYTSQGCSSCPPADGWLATLPGMLAVVPLALHVDYWDYIGWKDPYAQSAFSQRQRDLARRSGSRTLYTPGVFLQGREFRHWSNGRAFAAAVRALQDDPARARLSLAVESGGDAAARLRVTAAADTPVRLHVALTEGGLSTPVPAGENAGAMLHNEHVVRRWHGPLDAGTHALPLPAVAAGSARWHAVAFVEDARDGVVLQAVRLPLKDCAGG